jgi:hypothetical protein
VRVDIVRNAKQAKEAAENLRQLFELCVGIQFDVSAAVARLSVFCASFRVKVERYAFFI